MMKQYEDAANLDCGIRFLERLGIPDSLPLPLRRAQRILIAVQDDQEHRTECHRVPVLSPKEGKAAKDILLRMFPPSEPVFVVSEGGDRRYPQGSNRSCEIIELLPVAIRRAVKDKVAGERKEIGLRLGDPLQDAPALRVVLLSEHEAFLIDRGLLDISGDDKARALAIIRTRDTGQEGLRRSDGACR